MRRGASAFLFPLATALTLFLALTVVRVHENIARLPNPLHLDLTLSPGELPRSEPIIVAGESGRGDFLSVRFVDPFTVRFIYDSWGHPGIPSAPVALPPDRRLRLTIAMPALDHLQNDYASSPGRVRVTAGGVTVLDTVAHFYPRDPARIYFAENPLGGSACRPLLHGRIFAEQGGELRGTPNLGFPPHDRLARLGALITDWFKTQPRQVLALLACCLAGAFLAARLLARGLSPRAGLRLAARHRWFLGAAGVVTLGFTWVVTLGTFRFNEREVFGNFYDYQAASLLAGRLDVPEEAIGGEAFQAHGKLYGYFGPTPALLRLPFVATGLAFGKLSRAYMLAYFVASLLAAYLLLQEALRLRDSAPTPGGGRISQSTAITVGGALAAQRGAASAPPTQPSNARDYHRQTAAPDAPPSPFATCILILSAGWGSTIFFLGSRGLIFHEAILGGIALALWSCWCSLRFLRVPGSRWWLGALVFGILSIHTRPPTGLFALTFLGGVGVALALRTCTCRVTSAGLSLFLPAGLRRYAAIGVACAAGTLSLHALAYLKFGLFDPAPLHLSRPYESPERLAKIDGKSFHAANLPFNFYTYVVRPNFRLERGCPWIYLGSPIPGHYFPKAKIDLPDHTLAITYSMPSLFALATLGCLAALWLAPGLRPAVLTLWLAALPMTLALFAAVATAQRYTGDFCPLLIAAAALALAGLEGLPSPWRSIVRLALITTTLAAIAVTVALTLHYQGETLWGVPESTRLNYQHLRQTIDHFFGVAPR